MSSVLADRPVRNREPVEEAAPERYQYPGIPTTCDGAEAVVHVEVHISQVHKREAFRHHSYVSLRADGVIAGLGLEGYAASVSRICQLASRQPQ